MSCLSVCCFFLLFFIFPFCAGLVRLDYLKLSNVIETRDKQIEMEIAFFPLLLVRFHFGFVWGFCGCRCLSGELKKRLRNFRCAHRQNRQTSFKIAWMFLCTKNHVEMSHLPFVYGDNCRLKYVCAHSNSCLLCLSLLVIVIFDVIFCRSLSLSFGRCCLKRCYFSVASALCTVQTMENDVKN